MSRTFTPDRVPHLDVYGQNLTFIEVGTYPHTRCQFRFYHYQTTHIASIETYGLYDER
jgi:hypothetical protein